MRKVDPAKAYRIFYPSVPSVAAATHRGKTSAMPVVSLVFLSNDPPLVGISSSSSHATYRTIVAARCFSLSWLDSKHYQMVECLGSSSGSGVRDKLGACGLHHSARGSPPIPSIREAVASMDCALEEVRSYGDHELIVGRVLAARAKEDFQEYWSFRDYSPILYTGLGRKPMVGSELTRP